MAFEDKVAVIACPACKASHRAKWARLPVRDWQMVRCAVCDGVLVAGKSVKFYYEVTLMA